MATLLSNSSREPNLMENRMEAVLGLRNTFTLCREILHSFW